MKLFFDPKSVVVVGAANAPFKTQHRIPLFETTGQAVRALPVSHTYFESLLKRKFARGSALQGDCSGAEAAS